MRHFAKYLFTMVIVVLILGLLDLGILVGVTLVTHGDTFFVSVEQVSMSIKNKDGTYVLDQARQEELDELNAFLLIIGEEGQLNWAYNKPDDVPETFSLSDVAGFSRWYLSDYPVYTWQREDEILVIGFPKDSLWKYTIEFRLDTLNMMITTMPYVAICNILMIVILPLWIIKKGEKRKERQRTEWIAGVSHDIRTPLSIVLGHAEKGGIIEKQCFKIRDLVGNLNTENKLEAGTGRWNETEIKLAALIREAVCDYMNLGEEQYSFEINIDSGLENTVILADENLIRRMVDNLISNSIHHNTSGCDVKVSLKKYSKNKVMLSIADNGCGVSSDILKKMNGRLEHDYLPEHGLGIRVVKQIAKKYRYKVFFESEEGNFFKCEIICSIYANPLRWRSFMLTK